MRPKFRLNNPDLKERRQKLRNNATPAEKILWTYLQKSKLGYKFQRQYSLDYFIVDFYCPEKKLAIELDGGHHGSRESQIHDKHRSRYLTGFNVKVIRFRNEEVTGNIKKVLTEIEKHLSPSYIRREIKRVIQYKYDLLLVCIRIHFGKCGECFD